MHPRCDILSAQEAPKCEMQIPLLQTWMATCEGERNITCQAYVFTLLGWLGHSRACHPGRVSLPCTHVGWMFPYTVYSLWPSPGVCGQATSQVCSSGINISHLDASCALGILETTQSL